MSSLLARFPYDAYAKGREDDPPVLVTSRTVTNATVYRVYEYAVPVTTVATVPSAFPTTAGIPGIAAYPAGKGGKGGFGGI